MSREQKPAPPATEPSGAPSTDRSPGGVAAFEALLAEWLSGLSDRSRERHRSDDLVEAYRGMGRTAVEVGLGVSDPFRTPGLDPERSAELDRAAARVTAAVRRSGLLISDALDDISDLARMAADGLRGDEDVPDRAADLVDATLRITAALDVVTRRVVRTLERSTLRAERERTEALAAMTDQLSHELKNRLGAARTASQMLTSKELELDDVRAERAGELVRTSIEAALDTVGDVRALVASRAEIDEGPVRTSSLPRLVRSVIEDLSAPALEVGVDLGVDGELVDCEVDAARLRLIVYNLVGNGIKYRDPTEDEPSVRIRAEKRADGWVALTVADNGLGIPDDEMDEIFAYRARGSEAESVPGSGLGLAIVGEAVDQLGATIDVESDVGVGSRFTLVFEPTASRG